MGRKRGKYYIDPDDLKKELKKYRDTGTMSDELGQMFIKIATRYATKPNWREYSYKDDFIGDAVYRMIQLIDKIDLDHPKCNPFAYLTQQAYWCFVSKINKEKKFQKIKEKLTNHFFDDLEQDEGIFYRKNPDDEE